MFPVDFFPDSYFPGSYWPHVGASGGNFFGNSNQLLPIMGIGSWLIACILSSVTPLIDFL